MKKIIIISLVVIISGLVIWGFISSRNNSAFEYTVAQAERTDIIQTVSEVGTVKAAQEIELSFLESGKISKINVAIGDQVEKDQVLAELDNSSLLIKKQEAQANLAVSQANLDKVVAGASVEELRVSQASVNQAYATYLASLKELEKTRNKAAEDISQAEERLADLTSNSIYDITPEEQAVSTAEINLANTKSTYQQAIDNKINVLLTSMDKQLAKANNALDQINLVLNDEDADHNLSAEHPSYLSATEVTMTEALDLLKIAQSSLGQANTTKTESALKKAVTDSLNCLNKVFESLKYCYSALENSIASNNFSLTDINTYKTSIDTEQTTITTGIADIQTSDQNLNDARLAYTTNVVAKEDSLRQAQVNLADAINTAENSLASTKASTEQLITAAESKADASKEAWELTKAQYNEVKSGARTEDITLARAQVQQAEAALALAQKQLEDSVIKAPIAGQIVDVVYEVGEQVTAGQKAVSILAENDFEVDVDISEADIAKIKIGNKTEITLDAYGDDIKFLGAVSFIEPAETIIQDVIYYKVTVLFEGDAPADAQGASYELKSGMTANVLITTAEKRDVIVIPQRGVIEKNNGEKYVRILINNEIVETPVTLGLRGDEGLVEILSGVQAGDTVVTYIKENK